MNAVLSLFLRAKHWQIFLLVCGVYFIGQLVLMSSILTAPNSHETFAKGGFLAGVVMALCTLGIFAWFWSMGSFFGSIVKTELRLKNGFFHFALVYPVFYCVFIHNDFSEFQTSLYRSPAPITLFGHVLHALHSVFRV